MGHKKSLRSNNALCRYAVTDRIPRMHGAKIRGFASYKTPGKIQDQRQKPQQKSKGPNVSSYALTLVCLNVPPPSLRSGGSPRRFSRCSIRQKTFQKLTKLCRGFTLFLCVVMDVVRCNDPVSFCMTDALFGNITIHPKTRK